MKKYDEYKDSGVAWIGEVPKHWKVLHLKHSLDGLQDGTHGTYASVDAGKVLLSAKNVTEHGLIIGESERTISDIDHKEIVSNGFPQQGDILLCCVGTLGRCCIFEYPFPIAFQRSVTFLRTNSLLSNRMLLYILRNKYIDTQFQLFAKTSAQSGVYMGDLKDFYIVVPPINEQTVIATYLDTHCAKIDNLISIQQKRIALLQELKQSVITHAVTKGLNPNVEMKQSGVEWIGDVPKHWKVMPIKYIADTNSGATPKNIKGRQNERSDIKWVRTTDLSDICDYVYDSSEYLSREEMNSASCPWLPKNTVVVAMYGGSGTIGKAGILGCDSTINQALCSLETKKLEDYRYLYYNIKSLRPYWMKLAASSRKDPNISQEIIRNMDVPVPGIDEQTKIVQYLDRKCTTINTSISNAQHQIELLQEYKQSLITEVVTGKRKVTDN